MPVLKKTVKPAAAPAKPVVKKPAAPAAEPKAEAKMVVRQITVGRSLKANRDYLGFEIPISVTADVSIPLGTADGAVAFQAATTALSQQIDVAIANSLKNAKGKIIERIRSLLAAESKTWKDGVPTHQSAATPTEAKAPAAAAPAKKSKPAPVEEEPEPAAEEAAGESSEDEAYTPADIRAMKLKELKALIKDNELQIDPDEFDDVRKLQDAIITDVFGEEAAAGDEAPAGEEPTADDPDDLT